MKHPIWLTVLILILILSHTAVSAQNVADKILGTYSVVGEVTKEKVHVKISKKGNVYQAQIVWMEKPLDEKGNPKRDLLNPNPSLRAVTGNRIVLAWDLKYDSKANEWSGGKIYDPNTGKTYKASFKFESPTDLKVRGYIGTPTLGRTMSWKKIE